MNTQRLVIIDGKSVFYRGYYAMPSLATKDGTPTGGVYGFAVMALEVVKKLKPDYVCVAWDKSKTNIRARRELYPAYKGNRKPAPPDFYEQIPLLHEMLESLGWPLYEADDFEADDIMAAFAKQAGAKGVESFLVTSDLDVLQLVNEHTHIYTLKKGLSNIELFDVAHFEEKYGVSAHQWVDVKALKGDTSDNIPGVAGVGEKTALDLIQKYDTLDGVYKHLDELKPALKTKLEKDKDMAYLSKKLVTLFTEMPLEISLEDCKLDDGVTPAFVAFLRKLEFRNLLKQAEAKLLTEEGTAHDATATNEAALPSAKEVPFATAHFVAGQPRVVSTNPEKTMLWASGKQGEVMTLPLETLNNKMVETLANGPVIGHNLNNLFHAVLTKGFAWPGSIEHDTKIGAFLLNPLQRLRELGELLELTLDETDAGQHVAAIWQVYERQKQQFSEVPKLQKLAHEVEFPMIYLLAKMEHRGILLDSAYLNDMSKKFAERIAQFEQEIYELAGQEFNIGSPSQLSVILFDKLLLPTQGIKKGKTGYSTGASELAKLQPLHPIIDLITQYREYTKLKSTYIDALPKLVDKEGRLHTTFALDVAATGRLSSHDPNLQNIPTRTEIGNAIRTAFVPKKGNVFVSADYNQFELRLAAALANDKELIEDFNNGTDIHTKTAAQIHEVPFDNVTKEMRRHAKVINFGILYGMSPHGLSAATGMGFAEAKEFIRKYFELRAPIQRFIDATLKSSLEVGYAETLFGRRRPTPDLKSSNFMVREGAKRMAMNMPTQGTEADLVKMAMLAVEEKLDGLGEQLLQIHDSILVETPKANAEKVAAILKNTMETIYTLPVVLKVDVKIGDNWGNL